MNSAETLIALFVDGMPQLVKTVTAVPEDKLDWKPAEGSRTIRQLFTEAVMMTAYIAEALNKRSVPSYEEMAAAYATMSREDLLKLLPTNAENLYAAIRAFPESDYKDTLTAPWAVWTYFQTMSYPYWNMMWHTGQINYIQTMYGDQTFY